MASFRIIPTMTLLSMSLPDLNITYDRKNLILAKASQRPIKQDKANMVKLN